MSVSPAPKVRWLPVISTSAAAIVPRPRLWAAALGTARRLARPQWWLQAPYLPVPDPAYWRFRIMTALGGDGTGRLSKRDVISYVTWCRDVARQRG